MGERFIIALDQGTTTSRAMLFNRAGAPVDIVQHAFTQLFPQPGWVEHNPLEILSSQLSALTELLVSNEVDPASIDGLGITNQRETTVIWDRATGAPIANAIVWQCRRTASIIEEVCSDPSIARRIKEKTGLVPDAYFSASKIKWILDNTPGARQAAEEGRLAFGTVDSWLIWALTYGRVHATDPTNASRTMLYDIHAGSWDPWLCELFDVPPSLLPEVRPSSGFFGETAHPGIAAGIPITGVAGDQQAALFGQCCFEPGQAKNTYGTGCFLLMNTGSQACESTHGLVTTVAATPPGTEGFAYALEGSVFMAGALLQWLRDSLGLIATVEETEAISESIADTAGVYIVPAFTGLGAPHWDAAAKGAIYGLTRGTKRAHIVRAAVESLAYQVHDLVKAMEADAGTPLKALNVDGGASENGFLMQFQSDLLGVGLTRPESAEATALGAAFLAGLSTGFWKDVQELQGIREESASFDPSMAQATKDALISGWEDAVRRTRTTV